MSSYLAEPIGEPMFQEKAPRFGKTCKVLTLVTLLLGGAALLILPHNQEEPLDLWSDSEANDMNDSDFVDELVNKLADKLYEQGEEDEQGEESNEAEDSDQADSEEDDETEEAEEGQDEEAANDEFTDKLVDKLTDKLAEQALILDVPLENNDDDVEDDQEDSEELSQVLGLRGGAAMKAMAMKAMAMKAMKAMAMKAMAMKAMKAKKKSKIAMGRMAKSMVFKGSKVKTSGGLTKSDLMKNKAGKIVSKKQSAKGKSLYTKHGSKWASAVSKARKALGLKGFVPIKKGTPLYTKAKSLAR